MSANLPSIKTTTADILTQAALMHMHVSFTAAALVELTSQNYHACAWKVHCEVLYRVANSGFNLQRPKSTHNCSFIAVQV